MKRIQLVSNDLGGVRFTISPLVNLGLSLRAARLPRRFPAAGPPILAAIAATDGADAALLDALTNEQGWIPDFITLPPPVPDARIDDELARLRGTAADTVLTDLAAIHPDGLPPALTGSPELIRNSVADVLERFWHRALEPRWECIRAVLEADVLHRGRSATRDGMRVMLENISDRVAVVDGGVVIEVDRCCPCFNELNGTPLQLLPSVFTERTLVPTDPTIDPHLIYPARGAAAVWESAPARPAGRLRALLGRARADLLAALDEPDSSTRLAVRLGVTPSATNQHLRALRNAGLVASRRCGRDVLYQRTGLADALIAASM